MKVLSCFSKASEVELLAQAGADEIYCALKGLNSFGEGGKVGDMDELKKSVDIAHSLRLKVSLAVNGVVSARRDISEVRTVLKDYPFMNLLIKADEAGIDSFIVANPAVLEALSNYRGRRAKLHLSSVQPCFNIEAASFFLDRFDISRFIFSNLLSPYEACKIIAMCKKRGVETEIFDYRFFGCSYINGKCLMHNPQYYSLKEGAVPPPGVAMCRPYASDSRPAMPEVLALNGVGEDNPELISLKWRIAETVTCRGPYPFYNFSSFFDFFALGIDFLKYGTRQDPVCIKTAKVRALRRLVDLAQKYKDSYPLAEAKARFLKDMEKWHYDEEIPRR